MSAKKLYYIIEPIDVDNDKIPDGFLASQYRIDKYGNKIFTKNKYITFANFKSRINKNGGNSLYHSKPMLKNNKEVVQISKEEYIQFMNLKLKPEQQPPDVLINNGPNYHHNGHPNYPLNYGPPNGHPNYGPPNYPPNGNTGNTFMDNVGYGVGAGVGLAAGDALFDGIASFF